MVLDEIPGVVGSMVLETGSHQIRAVLKRTGEWIVYVDGRQTPRANALAELLAKTFGRIFSALAGPEESRVASAFFAVAELFGYRIEAVPVNPRIASGVKRTAEAVAGGS